MTDMRRIAAFLEMMSAERGAAANTLTAYGRDLADASAELGGSLSTADAAAMRNLVAGFNARGFAPATVARKLSSLKRFFRFLIEEGMRGDNPTRLLEGPRQSRAVPDVLSREEMERLLQACSGDVRMTCLIELLYGAGLRASEVVGLPLAALPRRRRGRWETRELAITGKGGRDRLCPLGTPALRALTAWLAARETTLPKDGPARVRAERFVFPSAGTSGHLTRRRLGQLLDALALKAGLDPVRVHPHALRHAYATHLLQGGADLRAVQTLLGHADISTTQIYTQVLTDDLADLLHAAHPLARARAR